MSKELKRIIHFCIVVLVLLVIVIFLPTSWNMKTGKSYHENRAALAGTTAETEYADNPYYSRQETGADETNNMSWTLPFIKFMLIVWILSLSWVILKMVKREIRRIHKSREDAAGSSAART